MSPRRYRYRGRKPPPRPTIVHPLAVSEDESLPSVRKMVRQRRISHEAYASETRIRTYLHRERQATNRLFRTLSIGYIPTRGR